MQKSKELAELGSRDRKDSSVVVLADSQILHRNYKDGWEVRKVVVDVLGHVVGMCCCIDSLGVGRNAEEAVEGYCSDRRPAEEGRQSVGDRCSRVHWREGMVEAECGGRLHEQGVVGGECNSRPGTPCRRSALSRALDRPSDEAACILGMVQLDIPPLVDSILLDCNHRCHQHSMTGLAHRLDTSRFAAHWDSTVRHEDLAEDTVGTLVADTRMRKAVEVACRHLVDSLREMGYEAARSHCRCRERKTEARRLA